MTGMHDIRTRAAVVSALCLLTAAVAACDGGVEPPPPQPVTYLALGDSIATGAGAETGYPTRYRQVLADETGAEVTLENLARDGWTSGDLLAAIREEPEFTELLEEADVVTLSVGGNDLLRPLQRFVEGDCPELECVEEAAETFEANWDELLDELGAQTDAELIATDLYNPFAGTLETFGVREAVQPWLDRVNEHIAASDGVAVAAISQAFHGDEGDEDPVSRGLISDDRLHPSDDGHEAITEALPTPHE
jgi:lysophospholipase L1-like esterase